MEPQFARCCWLALLVSLPFVAVQAGGTNSVQWGKVSRGFQLGVELEETAGVIHCWLRNATTNNLEINSCALGRWDSLQLLIRSSNTMAILPRTTSARRGYEGIGPSAYATLSFSPSLTLAPIKGGFEPSHRRYGDLTHTNNLITWKLRPEIPTPSDNGATFKIDLLDFDWPKGCFTNQFLRVQIVETLYQEQTAFREFQSVLSDRKFDSFQVHSCVFQVDSEALGSLFEKLPADKPDGEQKLRRMIREIKQADK